MRRLFAGALLAAALVSSGCGDDDPAPTSSPEVRTFTFDMTGDVSAWTADAVDLPTDTTGFDLVRDLDRPLPDSVPLGGNAVYLAGDNHSDDLFMYLRRRVEGLAPDTDYGVTFRVQIATPVAAGLVGIGGAPGESVFVKAGATATEPVPMVQGEGTRDYYRLSVDKGNQSTGSDAAVVLGHIARDDGEEEGFDLKTLGGDGNPGHEPVRVRTGQDGEMWIFIGTESGFEGRTGLYYTSVAATFTPR